MILLELFGDDSDVIKKLRDDIVDLLLPLAAHGVPFVTVDKIIDKMRDKRTGFEVTKDLLFKVLDPDRVAIIDRIDGNRIFFSVPDDKDHEVSDDQQQQDRNEVASKAAAQAKQNMET